MSQHRDEMCLKHMLRHAQEAVGMAVGKERASLGDEPMLRYALLHLITILGEAANRVSEPGRRMNSQIAWRDIISMRNMIIHGYDTVDLDILWQTVQEDLPDLIETLRTVTGDR